MRNFLAEIERSYASSVVMLVLLLFQDLCCSIAVIYAKDESIYNYWSSLWRVFRLTNLSIKNVLYKSSVEDYRKCHKVEHPLNFLKSRLYS